MREPGQANPDMERIEALRLRISRGSMFGTHVHLGRQLWLGLDAGLPVILHSWDAMDEALRVLAEFAGEGVRGVAHCFSGNAREARQLVDLGLHISFSGTLTYPGSGMVKAAAQVVPEDRLLVETDCPYLSPLPVPAGVRHDGPPAATCRSITLACSHDSDSCVGAAGEPTFLCGSIWQVSR